MIFNYFSMSFLSHMGCRQTRRGGGNGSEYSRYVKFFIEIWAIYERNVKFKARSTSRKCPLRERCPFVGWRLMPRRDGVSVITVTVFRVGSDRDKTGSDAVQDRVSTLPKLNLFM